MKKGISLVLALVMCLSLCACGKKGRYEKAVELMDDGNYEEARAIFMDLEDYEDSADKIWECEKIIALSSSYNSIDDLAIALATYFEGTEEDIAILRTNTDIHSFFNRRITASKPTTNWQKNLQRHLLMNMVLGLFL